MEDRARRWLLARTREWLDYIGVREWKPGAIYRCEYREVIHDLGLRLSDTKPKSLLITLRDNLDHLWQYEGYPQIVASQVKLENGRSVLYLQRAGYESPFIGIVAEV